MCSLASRKWHTTKEVINIIGTIIYYVFAHNGRNGLPRVRVRGLPLQQKKRKLETTKFRLFLHPFFDFDFVQALKCCQHRINSVNASRRRCNSCRTDSDTAYDDKGEGGGGGRGVGGGVADHIDLRLSLKTGVVCLWQGSYRGSSRLDGRGGEGRDHECHIQSECRRTVIGFTRRQIRTSAAGR